MAEVDGAVEASVVAAEAVGDLVVSAAEARGAADRSADIRKRELRWFRKNRLLS
jgi:hypothetical protein